MTAVDVAFGGRHLFRLRDGSAHTNYPSIALAEASSGSLDRTDFGPAGNPKWTGRTFFQSAVAQQTFAGEVVATLTLRGSGTIAADGRSLESLDVAIEPWYRLISGVPSVPARARQFVLAGPIPLVSCSSEAVEFSVTAAAVQPRITQVVARNAAAFYDVSPREWYESTDWTAVPAPTLTVRFSVPAASVAGQVYAPIGYSDSNLGFPDAVQFSGRAPLAGVRVDLVRLTETGGQRTFTPLAGTIADEEGRYLFSGVPVTDSLVISTTLRGADLWVLDGSASLKDVLVQTTPFAVSSSAVAVTRDVAFDRAEAHIEPAAGSVTAERLDDFGLIYFHAHQAFELTSLLGLALDTRPVPIMAYWPGEEGAYWRGPLSSGAEAGVPPHIVIGGVAGGQVLANSDVNSTNRPDNREWHEFGHHVMSDALGNLMPDDPAGCSNAWAIGEDCNHQGYFNGSTTDSWTEGFAEFFSLVVNHEIAKDGTPAYLYRWAGSETDGASNLETNFKAWRMRNGESFEEFAVAGLLWDLLDGKAEGDVTVLARPGAGGAVVRAAYADHVSMDLATLWSFLTQRSGGPYGYILTIQDLYAVLRAAGVGQDAAGPAGMTALDELFVAHGFFADTGANQRFYDAGEVVGAAGYRAFTVSYTVNNIPQVIAVPAQPARRSPPRAPEALVRVGPGKYTVSVRFEPPADYYDFSFDATTANGTLLLLLADADYAATVSLVPADSTGCEPLELTNEFLWHAPADENGIIASHTFVCGPRSLYLPLVLGALPTAAGIHGRMTYNAAPAPGIELRLRFYDGSTYHTASTIQTDSQGHYRFVGAPALGAGQSYYVRYGPNNSNAQYLAGWYGPTITSYTAAAGVAGGDFDLANIVLSAPAPAVTVSLPVTFAWQRRSAVGDDYRLVLFDPQNNDTWRTGRLGYTDRLTLETLPAGMAPGKPYAWYVEAWHGDESYGVSYYYRAVTFTAGGSQASSELSVAQGPGQSQDAPRPQRQD